MEFLFVLVWLIGMLPAFFGWAFITGRANERYRMDQTITDNPPFEIGLWTFWAWPVQTLVLLGWLGWHYASSLGAGNGLAFNKEFAEAKKVKLAVDREAQRNLDYLLSLGKDPHNIDEETKRMLTVRAIQAAMEDDSARKEREMQARALPAGEHRQIVADILDRNGNEVSDALKLTKNPFTVEM